MNCEEIIKNLESMASEKYRENVIKMGIPREHSIGVSTGDVRKLAKTIEKSNSLAYELWETNLHEAKLLAVLLFDKKTVPLEKLEGLMSQVISWDLCDHLCKNLIMKIKGYEIFITKWCDSESTYKKRAAFTLMASSAIHEKKLSSDRLDEYLDIIKKYSDDQREHVKKSVSWALREIGKRDFEYNEKAIVLAHELRETGNKSQVWIGNDALKELEHVVKVSGRTRLISSKSKMGKEAE